MKQIISRTLCSIILGAIATSCITKTKSKNKDTLYPYKLESKNAHNYVDKLKAIDSIPLANLPFGSTIFATYQFPKEWTSVTFHGKLTRRPDLEIEKIDTFFNKLNRSKSFTKSLSKFHIEYIHYDGDTIMTHDEKLIDSGYIYQLPNFGFYQCYYRFNKIDYGWFNGDNYYINYNQYGDLIFIDQKTKNAKILNVYCCGQEGDLETVYRYFYISTEKTINVFKREGYDHTTMGKTEIKVLENGEFSIKN